ncbi:MAG: CBS domain-containing protein [Syntrophomonadales bacterium]|jgi:CBS domain-containing protein
MRVRDIVTGTVNNKQAERPGYVASDRLTIKNINRVPVVNNNKLAGIVTGDDVRKRWLDEI